MNNKALRRLFCISVAILLLQGCAVVAVGAGTVAVASANDRRTVGRQLDDTTISSRISYALSKVEALQQTSNIEIDVYNGIALLTGQSPTASMRSEAESVQVGENVLDLSIKHVRKVHNQIRIGEPIPASVQANDIWLGSKIRTILIADDRINALHLKITVQDSEVFLMGLVNQQEAATVVDVVRNINGVARVVKAFEML